MTKLTWEWGDRDDQIIIRKSKGRLTLDDIVEFTSQPEIINAFGEGVLCVIAWRNRTDTYQGVEYEQTGDAQAVWMLSDGSKCFCGRELYMQYCPECGHKLTEDA